MSEIPQPDPASGDKLLPDPSAEEYMRGLEGKIVTDHFTLGWAEMAKADVRNPGRQSEDAVYAYVDPESGMGRVAVLDGAGGYGNGREAAYAGRQAIHEDARNNGATLAVKPEASKDELFGRINDKVVREARGGLTTFVGGDLRREGDKLYFDWGAVGDSLVFLIHNGEVRQLNKEETKRQKLLDAEKEEREADMHGNITTNAFGIRVEEDDDDNELEIYEYKGLGQKGIEEVKEGDVLLLVSDGVTGDRAGERLMGEDNFAVISGVMSKTSLTPKQKADIIIQMATKIDDRSALVVEIGSPREESSDTADPDADTLDPNESGELPPLAPPRRPRELGSAAVGTLYTYYPKTQLPPFAPKRNPGPK